MKESLLSLLDWRDIHFSNSINPGRWTCRHCHELNKKRTFLLTDTSILLLNHLKKYHNSFVESISKTYGLLLSSMMNGNSFEDSCAYSRRSLMEPNFEKFIINDNNFNIELIDSVFSTLSVKDRIFESHLCDNPSSDSECSSPLSILLENIEYINEKSPRNTQKYINDLKDVLNDVFSKSLEYLESKSLKKLKKILKNVKHTCLIVDIKQGSEMDYVIFSIAWRNESNLNNVSQKFSPFLIGTKDSFFSSFSNRNFVDLENNRMTTFLSNDGHDNFFNRCMPNKSNLCIFPIQISHLKSIEKWEWSLFKDFSFIKETCTNIIVGNEKLLKFMSNFKVKTQYHMNSSLNDILESSLFMEPLSTLFERIGEFVHSREEKSVTSKNEKTSVQNKLEFEDVWKDCFLFRQWNYMGQLLSKATSVASTSRDCKVLNSLAGDEILSIDFLSEFFQRLETNIWDFNKVEDSYLDVLPKHFATIVYIQRELINVKYPQCVSKLISTLLEQWFEALTSCMQEKKFFYLLLNPFHKNMYYLRKFFDCTLEFENFYNKLWNILESKIQNWSIRLENESKFSDISYPEEIIRYKTLSIPSSESYKNSYHWWDEQKLEFPLLHSYCQQFLCMASSSAPNDNLWKFTYSLIEDVSKYLPEDLILRWSVEKGRSYCQL